MRAFSYNRYPPVIVLAVEVNAPLVTFGGDSLHELREDIYDNAFNANVRAGAGVCDTYATALMGGEPYAYWY